MKRMMVTLFTGGLLMTRICAGDQNSNATGVSGTPAAPRPAEGKEPDSSISSAEPHDPGSTAPSAAERESALTPERRDDLISKQTRAEETRNLDRQGREGVEMTAAWASKSADSQSQSPINGSVVLKYNASFPTIIGAVLQLTDVELQAAETVTSVTLGDTARWAVVVTNSHDGELQRPHLLIKPLDEGLKTSLVVTTNKRTYHLSLQSCFDQFMHYVTFTYPDDPEVISLKERRDEEARLLQRKVDKAAAEERAQLPKPIVPGPAVQSVSYDIEGNAPWRPLSAYTDGIKTYIQMPATMNETEAPSLLLLRKGKSWFGYDKVIVNYRLLNRCYIVDSVVDRAILIIGQDKVTITKRTIQTPAKPTEMRKAETTKIKGPAARNGK